jgi:ribosome-associated protein
MLHVTPTIIIDESELDERFVRASGPGGQNVNKVATAVQLRFDVERSRSIDDGVRQRLRGIAGAKITSDGVLAIDARRYRTQSRNREDARQRLTHLIRQAAKPAKRRRKTTAPAASKERRMEAKARRREIKQRRNRVVTDE